MFCTSNDWEAKKEQQMSLLLMPWKEMLHLCLYTLRHFARLPLLLNTPLSSPQPQQLSRHCDVYVIIFLPPQQGNTWADITLVPRGALSLPMQFLLNSQKWWERAKGRVSISTSLQSIFTEEPAQKQDPADSCSQKASSVRMKEGMKTLELQKKKKK